MSLVNKLKNHVSDNRGKYGLAAGAVGAKVAYDNIDKNDLNQLGYNTLAKGNNLVQDTKEMVGMKPGMRISDEEMALANSYYNSPLAKIYSPGPLKAISHGHDGKQVYGEFNDKFDNGLNWSKEKFDVATNVFESNGNGTISIKVKALLESGYSLQEIVEMAVHSNHPYLNKKDQNNKLNREHVARSIKGHRLMRDDLRKSGDIINANYFDNFARKSSLDGSHTAQQPIIEKRVANELVYDPNGTRNSIMKDITAVSMKPRLVKAAKI